MNEENDAREWEKEREKEKKEDMNERKWEGTGPDGEIRWHEDDESDKLYKSEWDKVANGEKRTRYKDRFKDNQKINTYSSEGGESCWWR